jgi:hypothetical protein
MSALSVALAGLDRRFSDRQRRLEPGLQPSQNKWDAWPAYTAYTAFALLGLYLGILPLCGRPLFVRPMAYATPMPGQRLIPATPFPLPANLIRRTPPPIGNPRTFPGATPMNPQAIIPPGARPTPFNPEPSTPPK